MSLVSSELPSYVTVTNICVTNTDAWTAHAIPYSNAGKAPYTLPQMAWQKLCLMLRWYRDFGSWSACHFQLVLRTYMLVRVWTTAYKNYLHNPIFINVYSTRFIVLVQCTLMFHNVQPEFWFINNSPSYYQVCEYVNNTVY